MWHLIDEWRAKALALCSRAREQTGFADKVAFEELAFQYMELAAQVERQAAAAEAT